MKIVFFGTPEYSVQILEKLVASSYTPSLVVSAPDRPKGRGLTLSPSPVSLWGHTHDISVITPEKITEETIDELRTHNADLFIVVAYGKILKPEVLSLPKYGTLNVHPSLLPLFRGPSPIESTLLSNHTETGVSIMELDSDVDHGPVYAQVRMELSGDVRTSTLGKKLFDMGGDLLISVLRDIEQGTTEKKEQDHTQATFTKKIKKEDGLISLSDDPLLNYKKFCAYDIWPTTYFFTESGIRMKITDAIYENGQFIIKKVIPEGKKEMEYTRPE